MFKKRKVLSSLLVMLSLLVILAACAPEREEVKEVDKASGEETAKPEKLVVWVNDEDIAADVSKQMFDKYTEQTGIEIVMERVAQPDQIQELALAGPAGDGPDLFFQPQDRLGDIVAQGLAVPFDYTSDDLQGISEAAIDAFTFEGDVYGAPVSIETYFVYYNKSIIDAAPTTIEEVFEMSKEKTNKAKDEYGFLISPSFYYLYPFMNSYGGYVFGEENGTYNPEDIGLDNEGSIEGLTQYQSFIKAGLLPKTLTIDVLDGLFSEGKVGMVVSGPWNLPIYAAALGDNLATAPLPQINGEIAPSFVGVKSWLTSYYSKNQEWAQDLAKFLMNEENSQLYYDVTGELPPRQSILDKIDDPIYAGYTEQIEFGTPMPNIPEMSAVWDIDSAIELIVGGEDVQEILNESVKNIKDKIEISK